MQKILVLLLQLQKYKNLISIFKDMQESFICISNLNGKHVTTSIIEDYLELNCFSKDLGI